MSRLTAYMDDPSSTETSVSLESQLDRLAIEGQFMTNLIEQFRTLVPQFSLKLKELQQQLFTTASTAPAYSGFAKDEKKVIFAAKNQDYLHFGSRLILIPEGFKGQLVEYLAVLNRLIPILYTAESTVLSEYSLILSGFLTNKDDKLSLNDHSAFFKKIQSQREDFVRQLKVFFPTDTHVSRAPFKTVVKRMADIEPLLKEADKLTTAHSQAKLQAVQTATVHCVELLDIVIENIQSNTLTNVSPQAAQTIAQGAYEVGKYVELIGVVYYDTMVALNVVEQLKEQLTGA